MEFHAENGTITASFEMHLIFRGGKKRIVLGPTPVVSPVVLGRTPRISRLMALAIHFQNLIRQGEVKDYSRLAAIFGITRARVTQIMNLTLLAPDIQEELLFMPRIERGDDVITEKNVRKIAGEPVWAQQREKWAEISRG